MEKTVGGPEGRQYSSVCRKRSVMDYAKAEAAASAETDNVCGAVSASVSRRLVGSLCPRPTCECVRPASRQSANHRRGVGGA